MKLISCVCFRRLFFALIFSGLFLLKGTPVAEAQGSCDDLVVDEARVLGNKVEEVTAEGKELANLGADVRIRTIKTFGSAGNLDNFVGEMQKNCKSWQAADGGRKNNLIVLIVATTDRKTGLYWGSQWQSALGPHWVGIQTDKMNPRFRDGDFAGGISSGLKSVRRLIDLEVHPPSAVQGQAERDPLWTWIVILLAVAAAGYAVYRLVSSYKAERSRRRAAQQRAQLAKRAAARRIGEWEEKAGSVKEALVAAADLPVPEEVLKIKENLRRVQQEYDRAAMSYGNLGTTAGDPDRPGLTVLEYADMEVAYNDIVKNLQQAETELKEINLQIENLQLLVADTPKTIETACADLERVKAQIAELGARGLYTFEVEETLAKARKAIAHVQELLRKNCFGDAQTAVKEIEKLAREALLAAEGLPVKKKSAEEAAAALAARIEEVKNKIVEGRKAYDEVSSIYAESCLRSVRGNGTEAENRINWSLQAIKAAGEAMSMQNQQWQRAQDHIARANVWLDEAESFMRSVTALKVRLETVKRDAVKDIISADASVAKARGYITRHDEDVRDSLEADLVQAQNTIEDAKIEIQKNKPDYLRLADMLLAANSAADRILAEAMSEHEGAEQMRQRVASALGRADLAVSIAREFIEDHFAVVGSAAKDFLRHAENYLRSAKDASDAELKLSFAEKAEGLGKAAYAGAEKDFKWGQEAGLLVQRDGRDSDWGAPRSRHDDSGSTSERSSSWWTSSGGGGGSSDWGDSGGGGGGSSDSGSSGGGGGSTGW